MALGFVDMNIRVKKACCRHMCVIVGVCTYKKNGHGLYDMGLCVTGVSWEIGLQSLGRKVSPLERLALFGTSDLIYMYSQYLLQCQVIQRSYLVIAIGTAWGQARLPRTGCPFGLREVP